MTNMTKALSKHLQGIMDTLTNEWFRHSLPVEIRVPKQVFNRLVYDYCINSSHKVKLEIPLKDGVLEFRLTSGNIKIIMDESLILRDDNEDLCH